MPRVHGSSTTGPPPVGRPAGPFAGRVGPADAIFELEARRLAGYEALAQFDLVRAGLADERIVIEVTEHAPVADHDALARALAPVRAQGGRLAVDDAGAGFASLRHILRLGPDIIKLDIDLTRGVDVDRARRSLASALIAFGLEMGITIVAEGTRRRRSGTRWCRSASNAARATCWAVRVTCRRPALDGQPGDPRACGGGPMTAGLRVAIVDDHPMVGAGLAALLGAESDIEVVGVRRDIAWAIELIDQARPDVVVCDVQLGDESGFGLLGRYDGGSPAFVMWSSHDHPTYHRAAFDRGAAAFVLKTGESAELVAASRAAGAGRTRFSPSTIRAVRSDLALPTARELQVIEQLAEGRSTDEVAASLGIAPRSVESHLRTLFDRFGVLSRVELVARAIHDGWIRSSSASGAAGGCPPEPHGSWLVDDAAVGGGRRAGAAVHAAHRGSRGSRP